MVTIDRGIAATERLPSAVLKAGSEPVDLTATELGARREGERWLIVDGQAGAVLGALHAPALVVVGRRGITPATLDGVAAPIEAGRFLVVEAGTRLELGGGRDAGWVALALPPHAATRIAQRVLGVSPADPVVFADEGPAHALVGASELALIDRGLTTAGGDWTLAEIASALVARLIERQREHARRLARTSGRTERHRRHLYARLNRVRFLIARRPVRDYTMRELAGIAHLSVWHFVRSFGQVFDETPHRYLTRMRLESAARMLAASDEPIAFVAERHGFENRCAFARLFRAHFGVPASEHRRRLRRTPPGGLARIDAIGAVTDDARAA